MCSKSCLPVSNLKQQNTYTYIYRIYLITDGLSFNFWIGMFLSTDSFDFYGFSCNLARCADANLGGHPRNSVKVPFRKTQNHKNMRSRSLGGCHVPGSRHLQCLWMGQKLRLFLTIPNSLRHRNSGNKNIQKKNHSHIKTYHHNPI